MFGRVKSSIGRRILKKQRKRQACKRQFHNFNTAKSVGILYPYDQATENDIQMLVRFLAERNTKVQLLAYSPERTPPSSFITTVNKRLFHKEHLNWFGKPVTGEVNNFIRSTFDILIDFSAALCYPMQYVATLSHAQMRVGKIAYPDNPYEFILTIPEQGNNKFFIEQLKHYLLSIQIK